MTTFEYNPPGGGAIKGGLAIAVKDPKGVEPKNVIHITDPWELKVQWNIQGDLVRMLAGKWHVTAYMEMMGPGVDLELPTPKPFEIEIDEGTASGNPVNCYEYNHVFEFGPKDVKNEGVYKLIVVLTSLTERNEPGPFAAYSELETLLQFYP